MRYKRRIISYCLLSLVLFSACLSFLLPLRVQAEDKPVHILVVYPEEADRIKGEDSMAAVGRVILSLGYEADYMEAGEAKGHLTEYDQVIWCAVTDSGRLSPSLLEGYHGHLLILGSAYGLEQTGLSCPAATMQSISGAATYTFYDDIPFSSSVPLFRPGLFEDADYSSGTLETANGPLPLVTAKGDTRYIPLCNYTSDFAKAVLMQEIARWLWPYESKMHIYTEYIVLDEVYPFTDLERFSNVVEYLTSNNITFVISVMPIYQNADYPAMQRFCDILRFAQANDGAVILHAPIVQNGLNATALAQELTVATMNYIDNGVYPLALEIPSEWIFSEDVIPILGRYATLFLSEMDAFSDHPVDTYGCSDFLKLGSQRIQPALKLDENGISHLGRCSTAVYLNLAELEDDQLYTAIDAAKNAPIPMQDLRQMDEAVYLNENHYLTWDGSTLIVDGEQRFNSYVPLVEEEKHDYKRNTYYRFVANLKNQNHFLIGLSLVVLLIFLMLTYFSRRQMHNRFLHRKDVVSEEEQKETE